MKKSKIIVPALAMIAFSTAASIAGSVAWFTASRQVNFDAGEYSVVKLTSNLDCVVTGGVGTTVDTDTNTVTFNGLLTDGSFNHKTKTFYKPTADGKHISNETYVLGASGWQTGLVRGTANAKTVYTAATFEISFTVNFGSGAPDLALFLNNEGQANTKVTTTGTVFTASGFRMAFIPGSVMQNGSTGRSTVLADLQDFGNCKYVSGTSDAAYLGTAYEADDHDLIDQNFVTAVPSSPVYRDNLASRVDYLGTICPPTSTETHDTTVSYTVVCWFEGTDPNVKNRANANEYQTVQADLVFDAVDITDVDPNA